MDQTTDNRAKAGEEFRLQTSDFILQTSDFRLQKFFFLKTVGSRKSEVCCLKSLNQYSGFFSIHIHDLADKTHYSTIQI